jgi:tRNA threonylcarbamoyl adenosine modification protein (Sua5/YciO/YrdC/YwlC family)
MSARYDCTDAAQRVTGLAEAAASLRKGDLAVIPTDTVYGLAADAFSPPAVTGLLAAKGRDRQMPPPVLVGTVRAATALVEDLSASAKDLMDEFWPGALTLVLRANRNLIWDLGETKGTVAVRMPLHEITLELLKETGPLAVSSANRSGAPPATTAADAEAQLGEAVAVYLDGGPCSGDVPSTIVDLTGAVPKLLRRGVISIARLREVVTLAVDDEWLEDESGAAADGVEAGGTGADSVAADSAAADGAAADGVAADGVAADGPADGVTADSVTADSVTADSATADSAAADSAVADSAEADGAAPDGAAAE